MLRLGLLYTLLICLASLVASFRPSLRGTFRPILVIGAEGSEAGEEATDSIKVAKDGILRLTSYAGVLTDRQKSRRYDVEMGQLLELQGYIAQLEESKFEVKDMEGGEIWELIYTNDDPTRSSPFFSAFRKGVKGVKTPIDPLNAFPKDFADAIFSITDNIPIKDVGRVRQYIDEKEGGGAKRMKSEVRVLVNPVGSSLMCTTSDIAPAIDDSSTQRKLYNLKVVKTEVLDSTVAKYLPFLDPASNPNGFPSGAVLELTNPGSSTFQYSVTFNDGDLRISRSLEDPISIFIYKKIESEEDGEIE